MVCLKENILRGSNISFKKDNEKVVLLQVKNLIHITFPKHINIAHEKDCAHFKMKDSFQVHDLVHDF